MNRIFFFFPAFFLFVFVGAASFAFTGDVPSNVQVLEKRGVFADEKAREYNASDYVTRGEFLQWVMENARFSPKLSLQKKEPFVDIKRRDPLHPYVASAYAAGALDFLDGKKKFLPNRKISRQEAMHILLSIQGVSSFQRYTKKSHLRWKDLPGNPKDAAVLVMGFEQRFLKKTSKTTLSPRKKLELREVVSMLSRIVSREKQSEQKEEKTDIEVTESLIFQNFWRKEEVELEKIREAAISSMLESLDDPYSVYLPKVVSENFTNNLQNENSNKLEYAGIGVAIQIAKEGGIVITEVFPQSPALSVKLQQGDVIIAADGQDFSNITETEQATQFIKGPVGTPVNLTVLRNGKKFLKTVIRKKISLDGYSSVLFEKTDDILWVKVRSFGGNTAGLFLDILEKNIDKKTKGLVVDLRYNGGGYMMTAQKMLGELLSPGHLALRTIKGGVFSDTPIIGKGKFADIPLIVLQNKYSASASEIFAGAIKDYERGTIVGETSFGKGIAQNLYTLSNGGSVKLTTSEFRTPLGNPIHKVGIVPDIEIKNLSKKTLLSLFNRVF